MLKIFGNVRNIKEYKTKNGKPYYIYYLEYDNGNKTIGYYIKSWKLIDNFDDGIQVIAQVYNDKVNFVAI